MKTRHGIGVGLVGLLLSTVAFGADSAAPEVTEEVAVAAVSTEHRDIEEIVVTARHPDAEPKSIAVAIRNPLELLRDAPIDAPAFTAELLIKPEVRLTL